MGLIDAQTFLKQNGLETADKYTDEGLNRDAFETRMLYEIKGMIDDAPTVDAVPVVRCKDCVHYEMGVCLKIYSDGNVSNDAWQSRKPDDFCSYGEKISGIAEADYGTHGNQAQGMLPNV